MHTAALVRNQSPLIHQDIGILANIHPIGILAQDKIEKIENQFDILIDFTSPQSSLDYGINVTLNLLKTIFNFMHTITCDIDIIEMHHKKKSDIPSSTAIKIRNCITKILKNKQTNKINISSIRSGDIERE
uniref:Dihydrodipicolinate reductase C-terminal domain-containing protein n=1 Tax=Glossina pallidipes TaxID=7398 RepID=A0A1A9Z115_GLOPL